MKNIRWLIVTLIRAAFILLLLFVCSPFLSYLIYVPKYSPANFGAELERNRAKWDNADITRYTIVVNAYGSGMPWTLEVQDENVVSAIDVQGYSVSVDDAARFTVAALFAEIEKRYRDRAPSIQVSYNPTYGYPEDISINPYVEPCCQGYDIKVRDFQVSPQHPVVPAHTPRMTCTRLPGIEALAMVVKSDSLWVASWSSVHQLNIQSLQVENTIEFPDFFMNPSLLIVTDHGVWADGLVEWVYYDGAKWTKFEMNRDVAIDEITPPIYQSQDGRYWFSSRGFLLIYNPAQKSVQAYVQDGVNRFVVAEYNGDLFGARVAPGADTATVFSPDWSIIFDEKLAIQQLKEMPSMSPVEYADMAVGPDGSIWIADAANVSRYNPTTEQWIDYDPQANDHTLGLLNDLAVAPDGSIWLTDGRYVAHLIPLSETTSEARWEQYDGSDGFEGVSAHQISIGMDGTIWIGAENWEKPLNQCRLRPEQQ